MPSVTAHLLRRAVRSLRENVYLSLVATGVVASATLLLGVFLVIVHNLQAVTGGWERDTHISAWFAPDIPVERRFELKEQVGAMEAVSAVRYVSEDEARTWLAERVPEVAPVLADLGPDVLPASLEITLAPGHDDPEAIHRVAETLALPEFDGLDYGQQWVERFNAFLSMLRILAVVLGGMVALAGVFLVANTIHLVVFSRREELDTMRLVGASDRFVLVPFLVEALLQGIVGSGLAIGALAVLHHGFLVRLQAAVDLGVAGEPLSFLPWPMVLGLGLLGVALAVTGTWAAVARFLSKVA
ncbi:MAG: FtsX-like permease family protein [Deltaproteobacteria bacterium]|nr:FtsX-like permease family protein [Deltaproteobacteria bacterium]